MRAVWVIACKDLRVLSRDRMGLFWAFGFPLVFALFFGLLTGGGGRPRVGVDDRDDSPASRAFVAALGESLRVEARVDAEIVIPPGFARVELHVDPARPAEAALLRGALAQAALRARLGADPEAAMHLLALRLPPVHEVIAGARPASAFETTFPPAILWGVLGCVATFAVSLVVERTRGTYQRLRVAPIAPAALLAGKALACWLACMAVVVLLVGVAVTFAGVRVGSPALLFLAAASTAGCFVGLMMLLAVIGESEAAVAGAAWGAFLPLAMIGGGMVPLLAMPDWMLALSDLSPVKWGIVALEGAIWRGYSPGQMLVPCAMLCALGLVGFGLGAARFTRRRW